MADNPYLQHLPAHQRGAGPSAGSSSAAAAAKEPLFGFMPRKVTAVQVTKAMVRREMTIKIECRAQNQYLTGK